MTTQELPVFWQYMASVVEVLRELGGSASIAELNERVPAKMGLSAEQMAVLHDPERGSQTEVAYRIAWARTYLKKAGLIDNRARGKWSLTAAGERAGAIDGQAIAADVRSAYEEETEEPESPQTRTYLFAWNPGNYAWAELEAQIQQVQEKGGADHTWTCGKSKNIAPGSRFFLIRLGAEPRGIVGAGAILDAPREEPHWAPERAAQGETTNFVDVRFDMLARTPLVTYRELNEQPELTSYRWATQMSGVRIPEETAAALERLWQERTRARAKRGPGGDLPQHAVERWREFWSKAQSDAAWLEQQRVRDERRKDVLPEMRALVTGFVGGEIDLAVFRETFDRKTRNEWDVFGLKGLSGATFLNRLAKHLPADAVTAALRAALGAPQDEDDARRKIDGLMTFLEKQVQAGVTTNSALQIRHAPFFASACWHVLRPAEWPIMYHSACRALQADGLLAGELQGGGGYVEFRRVFKVLSEAVGGGFWNLEHLCVRLDAEAPSRSGSEASGPVGDDEEREVVGRVWLMSPGPRASEWDEFYADGIVAIGWSSLGDLAQFESLEAIRSKMEATRQDGRPAINDGLACYEFARVMQIGDPVFVKRGRKEIVGYGTIASEYRYEPARGEYAHVRGVNWHKRGSWLLNEKSLVTKVLTEIAGYPQLVSEIRRAVGLEDESTSTEPEVEHKDIYTLEHAQQDLFAPRQHIEEALELLRYKKNLVLQGPPGVGKTFFARHLAFLLLGEMDEARVCQVQFHPSYAYEDFVQGYRPTADGKFQRMNGPFTTFCNIALQDQEVPYVLIIDEINRGNLSKIFGELLSLIEGDKRSQRWAVQLAYAREDELKYYVPKNLHIIGTMNTADRSLALVDYALRRRFAFFEMAPGFALPLFAQRLAAIGVDPALRDRIVRRFQRLNKSIEEDDSLGEGYRIGHSYFCHKPDGGAADEAWYERIVRTEIKPLLGEYWYDSRQRVEDEVAQLLDDD